MMIKPVKFPLLIKIVSLGCVVLGTCTPLFGWAQGAGGKAPSEFYPKVPKTVEAGGGKVVPQALQNPVAQAAVQRGAVRCGERVAQFTNFLTAGGLASAHLFVAPDGADKKLVSTSLEVSAGQSTSYVGATYAPDSSTGQCGGVYEAVTYWPKSCDEVAKTAYGTFKQAGPIRQAIKTLDGGVSVKVYLLTAGAGCVSIKKEIAF